MAKLQSLARMSEYPGFRPHVIEASVPKATMLLDFVSLELTKTSRAPELTALELIELGAVYVNDERSLNPARSLEALDEVRIHSSPRSFEKPNDLSQRIVSESQDFLVVDKPARFPLEPTVDNFTENLLAALSDLRGQSFFVVNSLETETSGLVMFAKSLETQARLKRAFADGTIRRTCAVYTEKAPVIDRSESYVVRSCEERVAATDVLVEGRTTWQMKDVSIDRVYRLEIELTSMRPARLREELARLGCAVIGDHKNGSPYVSIEMGSQKASPCLKVISLST